MSLWNVSSASRSLIVGRGRHGHFEWWPLIQTIGFLILKSIFSLISCQVLQGCLLFVGLDMFSMVTRFWYRTKDIDFETKFFSGMCQVLQGHFLWLGVRMVMLVATLWYRSRDCDFELNFVYECVPNPWSILIISVVNHVPFGNSTLIQANCLWFWN